MAFPYLAIFGVLLLLYMAYSLWERLDPRYLIGAGLVLLVATAITEAAGYATAANLLAEYVFFLLGGGVLLLLLDPFLRARGKVGGSSLQRPADAEEHPADAAQQRDLPPEQPLDHLEQQPIPLIDAPGGHDDQEEQPRDAQGQDRQQPPG
jgi:hypothetical protein